MRLLIPTLLALLCVATASAASVEGAWTWERAHVEGRATFAFDHGIITLTPGSMAPTVEWSLAWESATGYVVGRAREFYGVENQSVEATNVAPDNRTFSWNAGEAGTLACGPACGAVLFLDPSAGSTLSIAGNASSDLARAQRAEIFYGGIARAGAPDSFYYETEAGWPTLRTPADVTDAIVRGEGQLGLFLFDAALNASTGLLDTRSSVEPLEGPGGAPIGERRWTRFAVVYLDGATFTSSPGLAVAAWAPSMRTEGTGTFLWRGATGTLHVDGTAVHLNDSSISMFGDVRATTSARPSSSGLPAGVASTTTPHALVAGEASNVQVDGHVVAPASTSAADVLKAGTTFAIVLSGLLALAKLATLTPFYTRLERPNLLRNTNRRLLMASIEMSSGSTIAALAREHSLVEGVVRHHVRMLERHGLVARRKAGRVPIFFALASKPSEEDLPALAVLRNETRRGVAEALAHTSEGLTQADLVARCTLSQRMVSHHLSSLDGVGLVIDDGRMPRRYIATARLRALLGGAGTAAAQTTLPPVGGAPSAPAAASSRR